MDHGGGPVPSALSLILKKPRRSRRSGDELPPWRPAGHDVLKDNASGTTSPRGDMRILRIFKPSEPKPDRRTTAEAAADKNLKPVASKQQAAAAAAALHPALRAPLGCIQNTLMQPTRQPAAPMQQQKLQPVKRVLPQPHPRAEDRGALRPPPWVTDRSTKRPPSGAGAGVAARARSNKSSSHGLQQGGSSRGTETMSGIPMYDPVAALSVEQQQQLYIIPAVARQQLSAGSSRPVHTSTPPRPSGTDLHSSASASPAAADPAGRGLVQLESGGGCSSLLLGGGPVELAALYEAGPGWRRSASGSVSRVQVATRSSVKGGGTAARTAGLTEAVSR